jgi:hypothetical protein
VILKYGGYSHSDAEVSVVINKQPTWTNIGTRKGYIERWEVRGILHAADADALRIAMGVLESAYSVDNYDLVLYASDGSTVRHAMLNNGSPTGVKIVDFAYPSGEGAEYTTYRTYSFVAEAEYLTATGFDTYQESFEFSGGSEAWIMITTLFGPPIRQTVAQQTPYRCVQQGNAVSLNARPTPPPPAFPGLEHVNERRIMYATPQFLRNGNTMYPVQWSYLFESSTPIFGFPPG